MASSSSENDVDTTEIETFVRLSREFHGNTLPPLSAVTKLDLSNCNLNELPSSLPESLPNLTILFLSNNRFRVMPSVIGQCLKLQMVAFKGNGMTSLHPDALQPQLRWLILTDNQISELPVTIGRCKLLQKCMLSGNQLGCLPDSISECHNLELIRLASNQLTEPPIKLLELPSLSWVGLSDNPFLKHVNYSTTTTTDIPKIITNLNEDDDDDDDGIILGQGAGGVTKKLFHQGKPVAVKIYKGTMTSDGMPEMERSIYRKLAQLHESSSSSPALIQVLGECHGTGSLVMEFLDHYTALADPPSLETCSRDVYHDTDRKLLSSTEGRHIVTVLLDALTQLHAVGICHGDVYGHNILMDRDDCANVKLSDFGAAFFYDTNQHSVWLERIELRAFGILVEEIITNYLLNNDDTILVELATRCRSSSSSSSSSTFQEVQVWWKQQLLGVLAKAFDDFYT